MICYILGHRYRFDGRFIVCKACGYSEPVFKSAPPSPPPPPPPPRTISKTETVDLVDRLPGPLRITRILRGDGNTAWRYEVQAGGRLFTADSFSEVVQRLTGGLNA